MTLDRGRTYLIYEKRMERTACIAQDLADSGSEILCVTRLHPELAAERLLVSAAESVWLSERPGAQNVPPDQLGRLYQKISMFLEDRKDGVVLLEGVEYLCLFNDFNRVLITIERINDLVMSSQAVLLMPIDPPSLDPRSLARLRRSAEVVQ